MFKILLSVIFVRGSRSETGPRPGPQFLKGSGSSSYSLPSPTAMPSNVAAMLFAVDQVRVFVVMSTPGAYRSRTMSP